MLFRSLLGLALMVLLSCSSDGIESNKVKKATATSPDTQNEPSAQPAEESTKPALSTPGPQSRDGADSPLLSQSQTLWNDQVVTQSAVRLQKDTLYMAGFDAQSISLWRYSLSSGKADFHLKAQSMSNAFYWNRLRTWDQPPPKVSFFQSFASLLLPDASGRLWYGDWAYLDASGKPVEKKEHLDLHAMLDQDLFHLLPTKVIRHLAREVYPKANNAESLWIEQARRGLMLASASPDGAWLYIGIPGDHNAQRVKDLKVRKLVAYNLKNGQFRFYYKLWPSDQCLVHLIAEKNALFAVTEKDPQQADRREAEAGRVYVWKLEKETFKPVEATRYLDNALRVQGNLWLVEKSIKGKLWLAYRDGDETLQGMFPAIEEIVFWEHQHGRMVERFRRAPFFKAEQVQELKFEQGRFAGRSHHNQSDASSTRSVFWMQTPKGAERYVCPNRFCKAWDFDGTHLVVAREKNQVLLFQVGKSMDKPRVLRQPAPVDVPDFSGLSAEMSLTAEKAQILDRAYLHPQAFLPVALEAWKQEKANPRVTAGEQSAEAGMPVYQWPIRLAYLGRDVLPGVLAESASQSWKVFDTLRLLDEALPVEKYEALIQGNTLDDTQAQEMLLYLTERYGKDSVSVVETMLGASFVNLRVLAAQFLMEQTGRYPLGWFSGGEMIFPVHYGTLRASLSFDDDIPGNPITQSMSDYARQEPGLFGQCLARYHANYQEMNFRFGVELVPYGSAMEIMVSSPITHQKELADCVKMAFIRGFGRIATVGGQLPRITGGMTLEIKANTP